MNQVEVVGLGALNLDHLHRVKRILIDGETVVKETISSPGGSAANTVYGLAKLRVKTGVAGVVGDDAEGKMLLKDFRKAGVDTSQIRVKHGARTGSVLCLSDSLGRRSLYIMPGANNLLTRDDLDLNYINQAKILHLSSFADDRQFKVSLDLIPRLASSVKVSLAPGSCYVARGLKALRPILERTYVLFINRDELQQLTEEDVISGAESCLEQGCHIVVVTLGGGMKLKSSQETSPKIIIATSYIRSAEIEYFVEPDNKGKMPREDTTGAGDAFATGFLYGLLKGKGLEECGRLGNIVAQFSIRKVGAREGLPTINKLARRYQKLHSEQL